MPDLIPFDNISVAAPCNADWNQMTGDERVRHCALCRKNVYFLSAMTRAEAEALIKEKEGHLCVRYYRRADSTILTDNCPMGLRAIRRRLRWIGAGVAALLTFGVFKVAASPNSAPRPSSILTRLSQTQPFKTVVDFFSTPAKQRVPVMGDVMMGTPAKPPLPSIPPTPSTSPATPPAPSSSNNTTN